MEAAKVLEIEAKRRLLSRKWSWSSGFNRRPRVEVSRFEDVSQKDEEASKWAAIEKLSTHEQLRRTVIKPLVQEGDDDGQKLVLKEVDVRNLGNTERQQFIERVLKVAMEDNEKFLERIKQRFHRAGINLPTVEVRFNNLSVGGKGYIGHRALPTLTNVARNILESTLNCFGIQLAQRAKICILEDISGIIKPSRMTLLLGPPSSGKTTLLLSLAGKLDPSLEVKGDISYNGYQLNEFVPRKTSAYISQTDVHVGEMTVKETLDFSARCQGVGSRYELLKELVKKEMDAGIFPEGEVDLFMKATAMEGVESTLVTDYILRILGLDVCRDTIVGDEMRRGISGGQKKRLTTGEMIVGPTKALFMDEISNGLDSSTTVQVVKCLQQIARLTEATIFVSLLQPAPETYDLFDDVILLSEGHIVYQGPKEHVLEFFESCGFMCLERKGTADFLQEVTSRKDQKKYWADQSKPYTYISPAELAKKFKNFHVGLELQFELSDPYDKSWSHEQALAFKMHSVSTRELLRANFSKEWLLIKRNYFFYVFRTVQITVIALVLSTVFLRTEMRAGNEEDGALYIGALVFSILAHTFIGYTELAITISRLPVLYKQRDLLLYPPWAFTIPNILLNIPISCIESIAWMVVTYYTIGYAPEASRFFKQLLIVFLIQQMAAGMFKFIAAMSRTMVIANAGGNLAILFFILMGGFLLPRDQIPNWLQWGYWISPITYGFNALAVNEMFATRWMDKLASDNTTRLGLQVLENIGAYHTRSWFWIGAAGLLGLAIFFNILFTFGLVYLNPFGKTHAMIPKEGAKELGDDHQQERKQGRRYETTESMKGLVSVETTIQSTCDDPDEGMIPPFTKFSISFHCVNYFVDMPPEMKELGAKGEKLQLLREITGAFRPGILTALMGVSGAGKTTLMDVLAGRKTGGFIEGDIRISGFPKKQETFARISGYCEQTDIHSPQVTVHESLIFSAFLRLPEEISKEEKMTFVDKVMDLVELDNLKDQIVGLPGVSGLSTEQRKRLTIAVELVSNPSIIFMDEPTSGLDARSAAIVMRVVRNTVNTGRTVVCTIHQPGIDIFEAFDELLLMKMGGQLIYAGPLGHNSQKVIEFFEGIPGVPKIKDKQNPATWMLEVTSAASEIRLGIDFAEHYKSSPLYELNNALVKELSKPFPGASEVYFPQQYSQSTLGQFKICLWKQWLNYWRSPDYNLVRYFYCFATGLMIGTVFWKVGSKRESSGDLLTIIGAMFTTVMYIGSCNCTTVQPVISIERLVFYRERAAGLYSALPYAIAQVIVEVPYVFVQTAYYALLVYSMLGFQWTLAKFSWFYFVNFFSFLYFTYYGMMSVSISQNLQSAAVISGAFNAFFILFSGFFIPKTRIPKWWIWYYWICPLAWTVRGLIVSQYGDVEDTIKVPGMSTNPRIKDYIRDHYGFQADFMGPVAVVLIGFTIFFAFVYCYSIKKLNFQMR